MRELQGMEFCLNHGSSSFFRFSNWKHGSDWSTNQYLLVIFSLEMVRVDKIVCSVDDPLIQLIIFLPSTLFVVTAVGVIIYCCHRSRQLRKTKNQKTYRVFSPRNFDSKDISEFGARIDDERALPNVKSPRNACNIHRNNRNNVIVTSS